MTTVVAVIADVVVVVGVPAAGHRGLISCSFLFPLAIFLPQTTFVILSASIFKLDHYN